MYDPLMYKKNSVFLNKKDFNDSLDLAIIFITTEGIQHMSGGVGRYIKNFIETIYKLRHVFKEFGVNITIYSAEPALLKVLPTYNQIEFDKIRKIIEDTGGKFYKLVNNTYGQDWIHYIENWKILSASAATITLNVSEKHEATLAFTGCSCLALAPVYMHKQIKAFEGDIRTVFLTHDSAFSMFWKEKNENILSMEYLLSKWCDLTPNCKIGYVSNYMKKLFENQYNVKEENFIPAKSGLLLNEKRFKFLTNEEISFILDKYKIPKNKKLIFSWGRSTRYKRLDLIFAAGKSLNSEFFPIVITNEKYPELKAYKEKNELPGLLIESYSGFTLINAILQWKNTICVALLAEGEPGAVVPMEAMYLSSSSKAVVLTNDMGIYYELIKNNVNGFVVSNNPEEISKKIVEISNLSTEKIEKIHKQAVSTIVNSFNQEKFFIETLASCVPKIESIKKEILKQIAK